MSHLGVEVPLPDLLLEVDDHVHGNVEDPQLGLRLVRLEVGHADHAELLQGLVDVADPDPLPGVVGRPPLILLDHLGLRVQDVLLVSS